MGQVGPFEGDPGRKHLLGEFRDALHGCTRGHARCGRAHNLGRGIEVVARHTVRCGVVSKIRNRADRHHLASSIAYLESRDVFGCFAESLVSLSDHLIGAAQIVEIVYILRAEIELKSRKDVGRRQANLFSF